ncbi:NAD(P)-dependent oxidoreductase [Lutimaribacter sp. EGI FJ00015]|uniref:NAD(P)-dependent oxidoreductase n=1 Tax=Lutimaribacter degradans TaxID=2945989 RepID=A0ACC5ZW70_9RHOB|nr:L-threonate dehydrogenase [Lutimaribacter sp. EGI FJ00013]MCM2562085.1 NAD(P)-dependent oxidoreductase [Lutimaribacter sp. EGI FJ00013]MCO0613238.1 NAD(P)-dependent oxidoreductase [Lutimaribacter sp. EGI FJ00015]MCO0636215.1 NAD(P)-dependent oxidoreductase [Lutimaribacter sp. EGI FJ00014]
MSAVVHFAGLGSMGLGMAQSAVAAGLEVHGFDPDQTRVDALVQAGGQRLNRAAPKASVLVCVVLNGDQMQAALFGPDGWLECLAPGGVILGCATVAPEVARDMEAQAQDRGFLYLDAPISGGAAKAAQGRLSIMASGGPEAFDKAAPVLDAIAETVHRLGDVAGPGSAMKAVNQLLAGVHIAAMGEALTFAASQNLDLARVLEIIRVSAGASWMFENRAPHVIEGDYTPRSAIDIWPKDLGIVTAIAEDANLRLPLTETALAQYRSASAAGLGREDDAAITKHIAGRANIRLPGEG